MRERLWYGVGTTRLYSRGRRGTLINKRSILIVLICVELMLLAVNRQFLIRSVYIDDRIGERVILIVLTVAAAESSVGLAVLVVYFRVHGTIGIDSMNRLHG